MMRLTEFFNEFIKEYFIMISIDQSSNCKEMSKRLHG